jgi:hypothetical protein
MNRKRLEVRYIYSNLENIDFWMLDIYLKLPSNDTETSSRCEDSPCIHSTRCSSPMVAGTTSFVDELNAIHELHAYIVKEARVARTHDSDS